jgi:hypothetical protein
MALVFLQALQFAAARVGHHRALLGKRRGQDPQDTQGRPERMAADSTQHSPARQGTQ